MSTPNPFNFPVVMTAQGAQPAAPSDIRTQLVNDVATVNPGYTANLPGSLIEDIASTDVAAIALMDQARVELINSLTPNGANDFLLTQLGNIYGVYSGTPTNTSVLVQFIGTVGYVIPNGFQIGDGTNTYQIQNGGVITSSGTSVLINAISVNAGSFPVPALTVVNILTSIPPGILLSVQNPNPGTPGASSESDFSFRARVLQAGLAASVGTARYIKTLLGQVVGITSNQVSVQQVSGGGIRVVSGGGDQYNTALALLNSVADPTELVGSAINVARNVYVSLNDYPDTYTIVYVSTQTQTVTMTVTWNTTLTSFTGGAAFPGLVQPPIAAYINALAPSQPINVLELNAIFQAAISSVLDPTLLTRLVWAVSINGTPTPVTSGTQIIVGDPESNFLVAQSAINVLQG